MLIEKDNQRFNKLKEEYNFNHLKPSPEIYEIIIPCTHQPYVESEYFV